MRIGPFIIDAEGAEAIDVARLSLIIIVSSASASILIAALALHRVELLPAFTGWLKSVNGWQIVVASIGAFAALGGGIAYSRYTRVRDQKDE